MCIRDRVIPCKQPKKIAAAILKIFQDTTLRNKLGKAVKRVIANKMSIRNSVLALKKIYERV